MISFKNVTKRFSKVTAVNNLSFKVEKGEIFALLGPNGAGKTTSVRMINRIIQPDSGDIHYEPEIRSNGSLNRTAIGYLPEERGLYQDVPVFKTLLYFSAIRGFSGKEISKKAEMWLERFDLTDRKNEKVSALSKGNQQKIQFISSILHNPRFAILDEPFSGFDPINQEFLTDCIRELRSNGMTILLSAHQMQLVERISDRILVLNNGEAMISGTMDEIREKTVSDRKIIISYSSIPDISLLEKSDQIKQIRELENLSYEVYLPDSPDLNALFTDFLSAGTITNFKTSDINLHEIFIQSFTGREAKS